MKTGKPRGCKPKYSSRLGMVTVRTRVAEQHAITRHARDRLGISVNQFVLECVRKQMPAQWIEQAGGGRPCICSKCGSVASMTVEQIHSHEETCWGDQTANSVDSSESTHESQSATDSS